MKIAQSHRAETEFTSLLHSQNKFSGSNEYPCCDHRALILSINATPNLCTSITVFSEIEASDRRRALFTDGRFVRSYAVSL